MMCRCHVPDTGLHGIREKPANQRHAGDIRSARERQHHFRSERDVRNVGDAAAAAAQDQLGQRTIPRGGDLFIFVVTYVLQL